MSNDEKKNFEDSVQDSKDEDIFIEWINLKYGVAKPIIRELVSRVGKSLPKIFDELRKLGYPIPPVEK